MRAGKQTTLRHQAAISGIGVHSGLPATLTILPAEADTGIVFVRCGIGGESDREVRANFRAVTATEFQTVLGDAAGPLCSMRSKRSRSAPNMTCASFFARLAPRQ